jgi:nucleoside-diphosphate-sugar epimerase
MDVSRIHRFGWKHRIDLRNGIAAVYQEFQQYELSQLRAK